MTTTCHLALIVFMLLGASTGTAIETAAQRSEPAAGDEQPASTEEGGAREAATGPPAGSASEGVGAAPRAPAPARVRVVAAPGDREPRVLVLSRPAPLIGRGERISLSVKDADLVEVVRSMARIGGLNLIIDPSVSGTVTAELENVPWDRALAVILKTHGLAMELDGSILAVAQPSRLYAPTGP